MEIAIFLDRVNVSWDLTTPWDGPRVSKAIPDNENPRTVRETWRRAARSTLLGPSKKHVVGKFSICRFQDFLKLLGRPNDTVGSSKSIFVNPRNRNLSDRPREAAARRQRRPIGPLQETRGAVFNCQFQDFFGASRTVRGHARHVQDTLRRSRDSEILDPSKKSGGGGGKPVQEPRGGGVANERELNAPVAAPPRRQRAQGAPARPGTSPYLPSWRRNPVAAR